MFSIILDNTGGSCHLWIAHSWEALQVRPIPRSCPRIALVIIPWRRMRTMAGNIGYGWQYHQCPLWTLLQLPPWRVNVLPPRLPYVPKFWFKLWMSLSVWWSQEFIPYLQDKLGEWASGLSCFSYIEDFAFYFLKNLFPYLFDLTAKFVGFSSLTRGLNKGPQQWERRVLTTGLPGNSWDSAF